MMISERKDVNPRMSEDSICGYERIHTYCSEENCRNQATHAYVSKYDFVIYICESCILNYREEVVVKYQ